MFKKIYSKIVKIFKKQKNVDLAEQDFLDKIDEKASSLILESEYKNIEDEENSYTQLCFTVIDGKVDIEVQINPDNVSEFSELIYAVNEGKYKKSIYTVIGSLSELEEIKEQIRIAEIADKFINKIANLDEPVIRPDNTISHLYHNLDGGDQ